MTIIKITLAVSVIDSKHGFIKNFLEINPLSTLIPGFGENYEENPEYLLDHDEYLDLKIF